MHSVHLPASSSAFAGRAFEAAFPWSFILAFALVEVRFAEGREKGLVPFCSHGSNLFLVVLHRVAEQTGPKSQVRASGVPCAST